MDDSVCACVLITQNRAGLWRNPLEGSNDIVGLRCPRRPPPPPPPSPHMWKEKFNLVAQTNLLSASCFGRTLFLFSYNNGEWSDDCSGLSFHRLCQRGPEKGRRGERERERKYLLVAQLRTAVRLALLLLSPGRTAAHLENIQLTWSRLLPNFLPFFFPSQKRETDYYVPNIRKIKKEAFTVLK